MRTLSVTLSLLLCAACAKPDTEAAGEPVLANRPAEP